MLSTASMVRSVFTAPLNVFGGVLLGALALPVALALLGVALVVASVAILVCRFPVVESEAVDDVDVADGTA